MMPPRDCDWRNVQGIQDNLRQLHAERRKTIEQIDSLEDSRRCFQAVLRAGQDSLSTWPDRDSRSAASRSEEMRLAAAQLAAAEQRQIHLRRHLRELMEKFAEVSNGRPRVSLLPSAIWPSLRPRPDLEHHSSPWVDSGSDEDDTPAREEPVTVVVELADGLVAEVGVDDELHASTVREEPVRATASRPGNAIATSSTVRSERSSNTDDVVRGDARPLRQGTGESRRQRRDRLASQMLAEALMDADGRSSDSSSSDLWQSESECSDSVISRVARETRATAQSNSKLRVGRVDALRARWVRKWLGSDALHELIDTTAKLEALQRLDQWRTLQQVSERGRLRSRTLRRGLAHPVVGF